MHPVLTMRRPALMLVVALALCGAAAAQAPQDLELQTGVTEIPLPPDGILRYGNVTIHGGADLRFTRNAANTPVQILATGPIIIEADGIIRLDGQGPNGFNPGIGGPGGFAGGNAGPWPAGTGEGPGAGLGGCPHYACNPSDRAGHGAFGCDGDGHGRSGTPYGNPVMLSLIGGSGGGGNTDFAGGGGGGAILLSSDVSIVMNGIITAQGGCASYGGCGSGGGVRLLAPLVSGAGTIYVTAPSGNHGRIRVDAIDRSGVRINHQPACSFTSGAVMALSAPTGTLRITEVGGEPIAPNAEGSVLVTLDGTAPPTVKVRLNGFGGIVPVEIALSPDNGDRLTQVVNADMETADVDGNVTVTATFASFPANQAVKVEAWTR